MTTKGLTSSKLISAIRAGRIGAVIDALDEGADIEEPDIHGHNGLPLRTACFEGNLAVVRELLSRGANPNAAASDGSCAPLRLATRKGHRNIVDLLLKNGATPLADSPISIDAPALEFEPSDHKIDLRVRQQAPRPEPASTDNVIEFTPSTIKYSSVLSVSNESDHAFGTETKAISADLLFLEEDDVLAVSAKPPAKSAS